jgi:zinc transporter, ZIP family
LRLSQEFLLVLSIVAAAVASPLGGLVTLWVRPSTLFLSGVAGFASGVLLATVSFEMLPTAVERSSLPLAICGFVAGFAAVYAFDLYVHGGILVGEKADQRKWLRRRARRSREGEVTVLGGGTSAEEWIEGLSIGIGLAIEPNLGLIVALAIAVDNVSEALSIGAIIRSQENKRGISEARRILGWTGLIGASLLASAAVGWLFLRGLPQPALGALFGAGAGGMFYLTVTDLIPEAEEHHYQQLSAIAMATGFMMIFALSTYM